MFREALVQPDPLACLAERGKLEMHSLVNPSQAHLAPRANEVQMAFQASPGNLAPLDLLATLVCLEFLAEREKSVCLESQESKDEMA